MTLQESFDQFWAIYPRRIGKLAAWRTWQRLKPDADLVQQIIESVDEHRRCKAWRDGYIPHPTTYLNQGRYLDELGYDDFYHARL